MTRYSDKINKGIDNGTIDTDEHFENLLTFKQNEKKFIKSLVDSNNLKTITLCT